MQSVQHRPSVWQQVRQRPQIWRQLLASLLLLLAAGALTRFVSDSTWTATIFALLAVTLVVNVLYCELDA